MNDQPSPLAATSAKPRQTKSPNQRPTPAACWRERLRQLLVSAPASLIAAGLLLAGFTPLHAQSQAQPVDLAEKLKEIEALKTRLLQLEREIKAALPAPAPAAVTATPAAAAPGQAPTLSDEMTDAIKNKGFVNWNELTLGKSRFKLYGFLRADAIYDDSRPNNTQVPAFILSEDPAAPAALARAKNSSDFTLHPRLTRLGLDFTGPDVELLGGAKTTGKAEIDFYNLPSSESRNAPRMRHAYLKLLWDDFSLLAGQTSDVISPIFPIVNPDFVMWGAGNLGDRRPQLRGEYAPQLGLGKFIAQGEVGLTGANDAQDLDPAATVGFRDGEASGKPTFQGRLAYQHPLWKTQNLELGGWMHRAWERTDTAIGTSVRRDFDSYAYGLDLTLPLYRDKLWLKGELWRGENLSDVRGGILQGINAATGQEVHTQGGWIELGFKPVKWLSIHGGYSFDDPRSGDLPAAGAALGRDRNSIWYLAQRLYLDPIEIGFDYLHWTTDYAGGFGRGTDNRFQTYISYKF